MTTGQITNNRMSLHTVSTDIMTIIMISVCVFVTKSIVHEIVGHGGATLIVGGKITSISTMWLNHTKISSIWGDKFVIAAGPLANLLIGIFSILLLGSGKIRSSHLKLFFWLTIAVNLFHFGSYMVGWFIAPSFDWIRFISDFKPLWLWKTVLILVGGFVIAMGFHFLTKLWLFLVGTDEKFRKARISKLTVIPWVTFTVVSLSGILLFKTDQKMMMIMGAFGNTAIFLVWILLLRFWKSQKNEMTIMNPIPLERNYGWIASGSLLLLFYIFIMGPGIYFV